MNYQEAVAQLERARDNYAGRPLRGRSSRLMWYNGEPAVVYHSTPVVTFHSDNTYTLNSGGYRTMTTKARINEHSPAVIYQDKGVWYVSKRDPDHTYWQEDAPRIVFQDGIRVDCNGRPIIQDTNNDPNQMTYEQAYKLIGKLSNEYARQFVEAGAEQKQIPEPSFSSDTFDYDDWPCCQTIDGLLFWLFSGEPNVHIMECALRARGYHDPYGWEYTAESYFKRGEKPEFVVRAIKYWLKQRRHILACELSSQPIDAEQFAEYFGAGY